MQRHEHPLFKQFPLAGTASLSTGAAPTPYHVYDGHGVFIGGTVNLAAARELLAPEQVKAIRTDAGQALMGIWVCNFTDASLGAHHELQFSLFVSAQDVAPVTSHPLGLIRLMLTRPEIKMLCHGLWNSSSTVVAYNRELLALDARTSQSRITREPARVQFSIRDEASGAQVLDGSIHRPQRPSLRVNLTLMAHLGLHRLRALAKEPFLRMQVLNPVGRLFARNAAADSFSKFDRSVVRFFDRRRDHLEFGDTPYRRLQFQPQFFQYMDGFKFVYLFPQ